METSRTSGLGVSRYAGIDDKHIKKLNVDIVLKVWCK